MDNCKFWRGGGGTPALSNSESCGAGLGGRGLDAHCSERNLGGVEQLGGIVGIDGAKEYGLRDTGNEVANVFLSDKRRERGAEGFLGTPDCGYFVAAGCSLGFVGSGVGFDAAGHCRRDRRLRFRCR